MARPVPSLRCLAWRSQTESCCRGFPRSLCPGACRSPHLLESSPVFVGLGASAVAPGALGAHPSLCLFQSPLALLGTFPRSELKHEPRINCFVSFSPRVVLWSDRYLGPLGTGGICFPSYGDSCWRAQQRLTVLTGLQALNRKSAVAKCG